MKILLIGSGGREHALAWALTKSSRCRRYSLRPETPARPSSATNVVLDIADHAAVVAVLPHDGGRLRGGRPEGAAGCRHRRRSLGCGHQAFGPSRAAAQLEGSKAFTKELCREADIPTAAFARFTSAEPAMAYVRAQGAPIVVKADGLAAGKGVVVAASVEEALAAIDMMFSGGLGAAGEEVVIEECMVGEEASFFALWSTARRRRRWPPRRTISAWATVIPAPTPAAWALIRPLPS